MKKIYLIVVLIIILAVAGLGMWYVNQPAGEKVVEEKPNPQTFSLTVVNNNVQVKSDTDAQFADVVGRTTTITEGSYVKTSLTGRAIVESQNQSKVVVDKNSEFSVAESGPNKTVISLASGNLWATVQKLLGQGEYFKVQTSNAVATVRGTSFGVFYQNNITTVIVTDSIVSLISLDPVTRQPIGQEVVIGKNQKGIVVGGSAAVVADITQNDKRLDWYVFNQSKDAIKTNGASSTQTQTIQNQTPPSVPEIFSVNPTVVYPQRDLVKFSISGKNLSKVSGVLLSDMNIEFFISDDQTISAIVGQNIKPGVYDVSVVGSAGEKVTLPQALSVK